MDEMLGNHYFLARNYSRAAELLQKALLADPKNKAIRRKLIVCFSQTGQVDKALKTFLSLVKEDIDFVIDTDPIDDDCPCIELVFELERKHANNQESLDFTLILGMLWLYCNLPKSYDYFKNATLMDENNRTIKSIIVLLEAQIQKDQAHV